MLVPISCIVCRVGKDVSRRSANLVQNELSLMDVQPRVQDDASFLLSKPPTCIHNSLVQVYHFLNMTFVTL